MDSFDIFIVNYSWLSKALEYAPRSTFKILDTHDKFSGRKEMLESLGLHPEILLHRPRRRSASRSTAPTSSGRSSPRKPRSFSVSPTSRCSRSSISIRSSLWRGRLRIPKAISRVGVIGARNNVNRMNIGEFLREAEPIFRNAFAPVKIVIAGSVCELLEDAASPFVELVGLVDDVEDFYRSVVIAWRCRCGARRASRSRPGEALSFGLPVLSLAHAFEGYEPANKFHALADFKEMAEAIVELSLRAARADGDAGAGVGAGSYRKTAAVIAPVLPPQQMPWRWSSAGSW